MLNVFIHGANSSSNSFRFIEKELDYKSTLLIDYKSGNGFYFNLENIIKTINRHTTGSINIISHSLGGIYGIHLTQYLNVNRGVSISTPFGGSSFADWAKYMIPHYQLFRDVGVKSMPITESQNIKVTIPWKQIVSIGGKVPWLIGENDGIVTKKSMMARNDVEYSYLHYNHYEIMCAYETVEEIKQYLI